MTIEVEVSPELEASLAAEAASHGMELKNYAAKLLEVHQARNAKSKKKLTRGDLHAMLREVGEGWENRPSLPTSAFTRESFYEDRT
jgi:hypothetical protein